MDQELTAVRAFQFGNFELDLRTRELHKGGLRLKLETKPIQVLELLVERAGDLVTRKELRERLWPDSFVEFDRGIYTAMNRLRKTLGDTMDSPRYIETRFRLGYRFVAPVGATNVTERSRLWAVPLDAMPTGKPGLIGLSAQGSPPSVATANPRFDGDALRFQVQRPGGQPADIVLRLTTTKEGALNMRLDFCNAGSAEGRRPSGGGKVGLNSSHRRAYSESFPRRARR